MKNRLFRRWWIWALVVVLIVIGALSLNRNGEKAANPSELKENATTKEEANHDAAANQPAAEENTSLNDIDNSKSPFEKGYYDYQGTIGKEIPIQMSLYPLEKELTGSYLYESQRKEINLKGKADAKRILLYEYDENGKNTGVFDGSMDTVDKIEGTWTSAGDNKVYPFTLTLKSILPGAEFGKRYGVATSKSDKEVEDYVSNIQTYIMDKNKEKLANEIAYPIQVNINEKRTTLENKEDFIKNYDKVFHPDFNKIMSHALTKYMFANGQGIMFGANMNNLWINEINGKFMITSINN